MRVLIFLLSLTICLPPALAQEREWSLSMTDEEANLDFGVPDTDDVGLSFWCKFGTGKVSIFARIDKNLVKRNARTKVLIEIDGEKFPIKMNAEVTKGAKTASIEGLVSVTGTVMTAANHGQDFALTAFGRRSSYPLINAEISGLLQTCSGATPN
jgi:hypothetical protein